MYDCIGIQITGIKVHNIENLFALNLWITRKKENVYMYRLLKTFSTCIPVTEVYNVLHISQGDVMKKMLGLIMLTVTVQVGPT